MIREAALRGQTMDMLHDALEEALREEGLDPEVIGQAEHDAGKHLSPQLLRALRDAHSATWAQLQNDPGHTYRTWRGTRPGSPLADAAFNYYLAVVHRKIQKALDEDQTLQLVAGRIGMEFHAVVWVDDIMLPIAAESNEALIQKAQHYVAWTNHILWQHGFRGNFDKGKTELLLNLRGKDAAKMKEAHLHPAKCQARDPQLRSP